MNLVCFREFLSYFELFTLLPKEFPVGWNILISEESVTQQGDIQEHWDIWGLWGSKQIGDYSAVIGGSWETESPDILNLVGPRDNM